MDKHWIYGHVSIQPQITSMESIQEEFNARVNLLMPSKVGYLHYIQDVVPCDVHGPRLEDDLRLRTLCLGQILMWGKYAIVIVIYQVEVTDLQHHNLSQLQSNCTYPLQEVRSDQRVVKVPRGHCHD
jgi:hypothetical protein